MTTPPPPAVRKLGPGVLTVGETGAILDFSARATQAAVRWSVNTEDDTLTLAGSSEPGVRTYAAVLEATVYQDDLTAAGLIAYSWNNKGKRMPALFTPYNEGLHEISGTVVVDPIDVGGEVGKKNTADLKWSFVGTPTIVDNV